jgi:hypothetical protein
MIASIAAARRAENPAFAATESVAESGFYDGAESAFGRLERVAKNPIYSKSCGWRLCARRNAPFMAQIDQSAPDFAPLIRDILEGLT